MTRNKKRRELTRLLKKNKKKLKEVQAEKRLLQHQVRKSEVAIADLRNTIDNFDMKKTESIRGTSKMATEFPKDMWGAYIVTEVEERKSVTLKNFYALIRNADTIPVIKLDNVAFQLKTSDLDLSVGALVAIAGVDVKDPDQFGMHIANIGPSTPEGHLQYEYALSKLGLRKPPIMDDCVLALDGQFRKFLTKGKVN